MNFNVYLLLGKKFKFVNFQINIKFINMNFYEILINNHSFSFIHHFYLFFMCYLIYLIYFISKKIEKNNRRFFIFFKEIGNFTKK